MVASVNKVYGSAPTHVAVSNFAVRVDSVSTRVTDRCNKARPIDDSSRARYVMVVRGNKIEDEIHAFNHLLENPSASDDAAPSSSWKPESQWKLPLSLASWLLMLLQNPAAGRKLRLDDNAALHALRGDIDNRADLVHLRAVATGEMTWEEYKKVNTLTLDTKKALCANILNAADIVCTTPSLSCKGIFAEWKSNVAQGIAVDEAANMTRPDLYSVWGNTLLPCLMAGDDKQLFPTVMTVEEKDVQGNYLNRFAPTAQISPLGFFKAAGWPIYRLRTQLRMARDLFAICHREVYSDAPFTYGPECDIVRPQHAAGVELEKYLQEKYPGLTPAPDGTLQEVFFDCRGTTCHRDKATGSKRNPDQAEAGLNVAADFVRTKGINPATILILSPYKAMVKLLNKMLKKPEYSTLLGIRAASTIDSVQGQEGDIVFVILGTTERVGPGFTSSENHLNVMLSRQRCGLAIFGDINVTGAVDGKGKATTDRIRVTGSNGETCFARAKMLRSILVNLYQSGRVITVPAKPAKNG